MKHSDSKHSIEEGRGRAVSVRKSRAASMIQDERIHAIPEVDIVAAGSSFKLPKNMWPLLPICVYIFLSALGSAMVLPTLPNIRKDALGGSSSKAAIITGLFESFFSFIGLFTGGMFGRLSDSHGRWPVLCLNAFLITGPMALHCIFLHTTPWPFLFTQYIVFMVGSTPLGNMSLCNAIVSDCFEPFERLVPLTLFVTAFFLGMSGSAIPSLLHLDNQTISIVGAGLAVAAQIFAFFFVKESLPLSRRKPLAIKELFQNPLVPLRFLYTSRYLMSMTAVNFCLYYPFMMITDIQLFYLEDRVHGFAPSDNAILLSASAITYIVLSYTLLPVGLKLLSPTTLICIASVVSIANNVLPFFVREKWQVFGILGPTGAMTFFVIPLIVQLVTSTLQPNEQGIALMTMGAVNGLASAVGPLLGAVTYSVGKNQMDFEAFPYCISSAIAGIGFLVAFFVVRPVVQEMEDLVTMDLAPDGASDAIDNRTGKSSASLNTIRGPSSSSVVNDDSINSVAENQQHEPLLSAK